MRRHTKYMIDYMEAEKDAYNILSKNVLIRI